MRLHSAWIGGEHFLRGSILHQQRFVEMPIKPDHVSHVQTLQLAQGNLGGPQLNLQAQTLRRQDLIKRHKFGTPGSNSRGGDKCGIHHE
ncbi:hypothetical protein SAMN02745857_02931 [Andreprevotia lacus DSM 23236]|uniref:Uncharacterized protein n=1 Tax=Andreprevotia lacus DSM 23236 TaxID=1121001 RepID=A0A1W1XUL1_9NEIS|nr:hypothetical protein SAMN02745857_02931 [Andreprevotia lacus DSM 23236]